MEWSQLDLRKASVLRKEVDVVLQLLGDASASGDSGKLHEIALTIQIHIDELDEFYSENQTDERASLFEKQRLRLRKALQDLYQGPPSSQSPPSSPPQKDRKPSGSSNNPNTTTTSSSNNNNNNNNNNTGPQTELKSGTARSPINVNDAPIATTSAAPTPRTFQLKSTTPGSGSSAVSGLLTTNTTGTASRKPLYSWEIANDPNRMKKRLETDYGVFCPCESPGLYIPESSVNGSDKYVDVQIVLTTEELMTLVNRQRGFLAEAKHSERFMEKKARDPPSVMASTPFMDTSRLQKEIYRPLKKEQWVHKDGFKPVNKKV